MTCRAAAPFAPLTPVAVSDTLPALPVPVVEAVRRPPFTLTEEPFT